MIEAEAVAHRVVMLQNMCATADERLMWWRADNRSSRYKYQLLVFFPARARQLNYIQKIICNLHFIKFVFISSCVYIACDRFESVYGRLH